MFRRLFARMLDSAPDETGQIRGARLSDARSGRGPRYVITFSPAGYKDVQMDWIAVLDGAVLTRAEVNEGFQTWLDTAPLSGGGVPTRTIHAWINGSYSQVTFRTDWVSGFSVQRAR